jgi:hypothetical protein
VSLLKLSGSMWQQDPILSAIMEVEKTAKGNRPSETSGSWENARESDRARGRIERGVDPKIFGNGAAARALNNIVDAKQLGIGSDPKIYRKMRSKDVGTDNDPLRGGLDQRQTRSLSTVAAGAAPLVAGGAAALSGAGGLTMAGLGSQAATSVKGGVALGGLLGAGGTLWHNDGQLSGTDLAKKVGENTLKGMAFGGASGLATSVLPFAGGAAALGRVGKWVGNAAGLAGTTYGTQKGFEASGQGKGVIDSTLAAAKNSVKGPIDPKHMGTALVAGPLGAAAGRGVQALRSTISSRLAGASTSAPTAAAASAGDAVSTTVTQPAATKTLSDRVAKIIASLRTKAPPAATPAPAATATTGAVKPTAASVAPRTSAASVANPLLRDTLAASTATGAALSLSGSAATPGNAVKPVVSLTSDQPAAKVTPMKTSLPTVKNLPSRTVVRDDGRTHGRVIPGLQSMQTSAAVVPVRSGTASARDKFTGMNQVGQRQLTALLPKPVPTTQATKQIKANPSIKPPRGT